MTSTKFTNPTIDLMMSHVSVRSFTSEPVPDEMIDAIIESARRQPTSSNWQTYSIIVIRDPAAKARLMELSGGQGHVDQSQVFLAFAADIRRLDQAASLHDAAPAGGLNQTIVSIVDAAIVGEAAQIAAESFGLGAVMVGALRRHPEEVAEVLGLPSGVFILFGMSIGWPEGDPRAPGLKPRLPAALVVHDERYSDDGHEDLIRSHDADLADFYRRRDQNLDRDAWSGPVARGVSEKKYTKLRGFIERQGFDLGCRALTAQPNQRSGHRRSATLPFRAAGAPRMAAHIRHLCMTRVSLAMRVWSCGERRSPLLRLGTQQQPCTCRIAPGRILCV